MSKLISMAQAVLAAFAEGRPEAEEMADRLVDILADGKHPEAEILAVRDLLVGGPDRREGDPACYGIRFRTRDGDVLPECVPDVSPTLPASQGGLWGSVYVTHWSRKAPEAPKDDKD